MPLLETSLVVGSGTIGIVPLDVICLLRVCISIEPTRVLDTQFSRTSRLQNLLINVIETAYPHLHPTWVAIARALTRSFRIEDFGRKDAAREAVPYMPYHSSLEPAP
jgi:hypothetical protein